ncbi:MAG TPA: serine hydrolase [Nakamurella sp.]
MTRTTKRLLLGSTVLALAVACTGSPDAADSNGPTSAGAAVSVVLDPAARDPAARQTRIEDFVDAAVQGSDRYQRMLRAFVLSIDGDVVVERYAPGVAPSDTANTFSVTKSVMSALVGIAIDEGLIGGVDATLGELLPEEAMPDPVRAVTLEQVLTMTGGFTDNDPFLAGDDWVQAILTDPANRPGTNAFEYSDGSSHLLSAILTRATGRPVLDYAREKLFDPLEVGTRPATVPTMLPGPAGDFAESVATYNAATGFAWSVDPTGLILGFSDLRITPRDMLRIGQLYLDGGERAGQRIVPADWVSTATSAHVEQAGGFGNGYGYQWWVGGVDGHATFAAIGWAGQLIQVVPDLGLVVVASSNDDTVPLNAVSISSDLVAPIAAMLG